MRGEVIVVFGVPGRTRSAAPKMYAYEILDAVRRARGPGCLLYLRVIGGRDDYRVSLELTESCRLRWECDCYDWVVNADSRSDYRCKHIRYLTGESGRQKDEVNDG